MIRIKEPTKPMLDHIAALAEITSKRDAAATVADAVRADIKRIHGLNDAVIDTLMLPKRRKL